MKKVFILQNSYVSFGLDAKKIFQPKKYDLYLVVNEFCFNIIKKFNQEQYYFQIMVTNDFSLDNIIYIVNSCIRKNDEIEIVTNSEETLPVCGEVRVFFGIDNEDYSRFYDKHIMKTKLRINEFMSIPKYEIFNLNTFSNKKNDYLKVLVKNLAFPLFIKPVKMYSSINLRKINNFEELQQWAQQVKSNDYYEVDEFIMGAMYHCDSYIKNKQILFTLVSKNSRPCYDFTVGQIKGTIALPEYDPDSILLSQVAEKTLRLLGMPKAGVTHLEFFKTTDNKVYFVEIAHRSPGCLIPKMYQAYAGIDTIASHYLLQIDPQYHPKMKQGLFAAWACYPKIPGKVRSLRYLPSRLDSNCEVEWYVNVGDEITGYSKFGRDYTGTVFMTNPNFQKLYDEFLEINDLNLCDISQSH